MQDILFAELVSLFITTGMRILKNARYMQTFYETATKQTEYIKNENRSSYEEYLKLLFSDTNAEKIKKIAKVNSGYTVMREIKKFLNSESKLICENDNIRLNRHIDSFCDQILQKIRKTNPDVFDRVFLAEFREVNEGLLSEVLVELQEVTKEIDQSELNIITAVDSLKTDVIHATNISKQEIIETIDKQKGLTLFDEEISIQDLSDKTQEEMKNKFKGDCCFEDNIYYHFKGEDYKKVSIESVYQIQKCILYSWSSYNELHKRAIASNNEYFKDVFRNYDENNPTIMQKVDQFYKNNSRDLATFLKSFINAETYHDFDKSIRYDKNDAIPTTCYIYGDAGIGKTTLTSKICSDSSILGCKKIFFSRFRELCIENEKTAYINKDNKRLIIDFSAINDGDVLWLDGLDETIFENSNLTVLDTIKKELNMKKIHFIITSRPRQDDLDDDSIVIRIAPFDKRMILEFTQTYFYQNECIKNYGLEFINNITIKNDDEVYCKYRVLTIPFILYMFLYNNIFKTISGNCSNNYNLDQDVQMNLFHDLLGENSYIFKNVVYDGKIKRATETKIKEYRDMAKKIAFEMFRQNRLFIQFEIPEEQIENKVFEFYLFREKNENPKYSVEFIHKSFYEYFLAEKLIDELIRSATEENFRKTINQTFGVNRIEHSLIIYIDYIVERKYGKNIREDKCHALSQLCKNLIDFIKEFCISKYYFENVAYYTNKSAEKIAANTFTNYISILLRLFKGDGKNGIEILQYNEDIINSISKLLSINDGYINLERLHLETGLIKANLKNAILRYIEFKNVDLSFSNMSEADLHESNLSGSNLQCSDLSGSDLSGSDLSKSNLQRANLSESDLYRAYLQLADLSEANLSGAYLTEANLNEAYLDGANLNGANLSEADISDAFLSEADLSNADLSGADLSGSDLSGVNLRGANLSGANLSEADLSGADLYSAKLNRANFTGAILNGVDMSETDRNDTIFTGVDLSQVNLNEKTFKSD